MQGDILPSILTTFRQFFGTILPAELHCQLRALNHAISYGGPTASPRNVVVLGGSFGGLEAARRLASSLPTGYRVVVVEPRSHLHAVWHFPRFAVAPGHERKGFIPMDGIARGRPAGVFERVEDAAVAVGDHDVQLAGGSTLPYEFLVVATGAKQPFPARVRALDREGGCAELRGMQDRVAEARAVAVVGGGAVGVEFAADVKSFFPEKKVALVHSRERLLNRFGPKLHDHVAKALGELGVEVVLGKRPSILDGEKGVRGPAKLLFEEGREKEFDLVIPCTGQQPNSGVVAGYCPEAISKQTGEILVKPTLQVRADTTPAHGRIFAMGDVAETGGAKMARVAMMQSYVISSNILSMIKGREPCAQYRPIPFEGSLKMALGKNRWVAYSKEHDGRELLISWKADEEEDMNIKGMWERFGAKFKQEELDRTLA